MCTSLSLWSPTHPSPIWGMEGIKQLSSLIEEWEKTVVSGSVQPWEHTRTGHSFLLSVFCPAFLGLGRRGGRDGDLSLNQ